MKIKNVEVTNPELDALVGFATTMGEAETLIKAIFEKWRKKGLVGGTK